MVSIPISIIIYIYVMAGKPGINAQYYIGLIGPMAKTLKVYTTKTKNRLRAQSEVVEEALKEFLEKHNVKNRSLVQYKQNIRSGDPEDDILKLIL